MSTPDLETLAAQYSVLQSRCAALEAKFQSLQSEALQDTAPETAATSEPSPKICTSGVLRSILSNKQYDELASYTAFDLDKKAVLKLLTRDKIATPLIDPIVAGIVANPALSGDTLNLIIKAVFTMVIGGKMWIDSLIKHGVNLDQPIGDYGRRPIHYAVANMRASVITALIDYNVDINAKDNDGNAPVHFNSMVYESLFKSDRIDINAQNNNGDTVLHLAARLAASGHITSALMRGANPNIKNKKGETPLQILCENMLYIGSRRNAINKLLDHGATGDDLFYHARKHDEVLAIIFEKVREDKRQVSPDAIIKVVFSGEMHLTRQIKWLPEFLKLSVPIDYQDEEGRTALHHACIQDKTELVKLMIDHDTDLVKQVKELKDKQDNKPIHYSIEHAQKHNKMDIIELLI